MDQVQFTSLQRVPTLHNGHGRAMQKSIGQVRVEPVAPPRQSSQSMPSSDHFHHRSGFISVVRSILPGHDLSASSRPRRSLEATPVNNIDNNQVSLLLDLEKTVAALEAEKERTKKLSIEKAALEVDNAKLVKINSSLVKENSTFRKQLQLESEEDLIKELRELHNRIQSWCQKFYETTARCRSTTALPKLPFASKMVSYALVDPDRYRVPYNIAAVWEYLLDHVFEDHEASAADAPRDLWTTRQNAKAIEQLDQELKDLNIKETSQWRSLTVRLLSQVAAPKYGEILESISKILNTVIEEITGTSVQIMGKPQPAQLEELEKELVVLVERAIAYSLVLRRQRSWICLSMPHHEMVAVRGIQSEKDLPSIPSKGKERKAINTVAQTCIFTQPQLVRFTTVTGEELAEHCVTVQDPEELRVLVSLDKPARVEGSSERRRLTN